MMPDRRMGGWTDRAALLSLALLSAYPPIRLSAQVSFHLAAGVRYSSTLVHDSIVGPVDLRPALAPTLLLTVQDELRPGWSADATLDVAPSGLRRHENGGTFDAGSLTGIAFTVGIRRRVGPGFSGRLGVGALTYAGDGTGVFREGSGGLFPLGTMAAVYAFRRRFELEARYDVHRFITPALRTAGFVDPHTVHRVAVVVRVRWGGEEPR